tara:strand:+ start:2587 stop:2742 length:156 start_codon:yes stop_codon:yes gene_type:complete
MKLNISMVITEDLFWVINTLTMITFEILLTIVIWELIKYIFVSIINHNSDK